VAYLRTELAGLGSDVYWWAFHAVLWALPISKGWHGVRQVPLKAATISWRWTEHFTPWLFLIRSCTEDFAAKDPGVD